MDLDLETRYCTLPSLTCLLRYVGETDTFPDRDGYVRWAKGEWNRSVEFEELAEFSSIDSTCLSSECYGSGVAYTPSCSVEQTRFGKRQFSSKVRQVDSGAASNQDKTISLNWLVKKCNSLASQAGLDSELFFESIVKILLSSSSDGEIENDLLELIGYDSFDFLLEVISNRSQLANLLHSGLHTDDRAHLDNKRIKELANSKPKYGAQVSIMTASDVKEIKSYRKAMKKASKQNNGRQTTEDLPFDPSELRRLREEALGKGPTVSTKTYSQPSKVKYPGIYLTNEVDDNSLALFGSKFVLPRGTIRDSGEFYDELTIPITKKAPIRSTESIVTLDQMDSLCKQSFKGYKALNRVQSIVYPVAYQTNENMLICAPTGAGKTDVAMLTILRTLFLHCSPTPDQNNASEIRLDRKAFKIVYVAPMKALAAEIVVKLASRLKWLGIQVKELTGDMQLTKSEIIKTQIIVTTPEKWDVVTRKGTGDTELVQKLRLLIIDEVHLLHDSRGAVIETIVARTLRQVESTQSMIRIVGLSATLPNYLDVAGFLRVSPYHGLFFFDGGFRPIPLEQHFIGVRGKPNSSASNFNLDRACFEKVLGLLQEGRQIMVFVHTRKETVRTAKMLLEFAREDGSTEFFNPNVDNSEIHGQFKQEVSRSRSGELKQLFNNCLGAHHAGMLRGDRNLTEKMFASGALRVLCCTATLAWGVNLPAYAVIIRGTQVYDPSKGMAIDLSILDVLQIFGRAGRPQFETHGVGYILTTGDKLSHYISAITQQHPIESNFITSLVDNLCAEVCLGTVTNIDEAVTWLSYTFLYVRMRRNPMAYGLSWEEALDDPLLGKKRRDLIVAAAKTLQYNFMIEFDETTGYMTPKDLGRIASNYYLSTNSVEIISNKMRDRMGEAQAFAMVSCSKEFENIKVREEETPELKKMIHSSCACPLKDGINGPSDKVNVLLQAYISRVAPDDFSLVSDLNYIAQNGSRILRAVFEIALNRNWGPTASVLLSLCKSVERKMWTFEHPLCQFPLPVDVRMKLEDLSQDMTIEDLKVMNATELGEMIRFTRMGPMLARCVAQFPTLDLDVSISPITRTVLRLSVTITPTFEWNDSIHGNGEAWWLWVEDSNQIELYHSESFFIKKKGFGEPIMIGLTIPVFEPLPAQIFVRVISDKWIGAETLLPVSFQNLILPTLSPQHTELLDLDPLPVTVLDNPVLESICQARFTHFNPVQTQVFHALYHESHNILLGAPTGSGKTVTAELAMWAAFRDHPGSKVVYVAPLKALVRERVNDWTKRLTTQMGKRLIELTGDVTPDLASIQKADIIITTPEKWDGISRGWQSRGYVRAVSLVIIDEIHLLGGDRGPILEVIVSRMNYITAHTKKSIRIVGLSTALANAVDLAKWLGIDERGLFNFRHSVRPVPLEVYIDGFSGKHYCPRMASMNRPAYRAIKTHSPKKPVIVFVSSRRQTRLTAQDLIAYSGLEESPHQFLHMPEEELAMVASNIHDESLRLTLGFGIGLHHAGLVDSDRKIVEELFVHCKIQVLVATSTLAWGVNFPAHLVVVKGTEFYDAKTKGYVDYPITDILQMMGRAGRPQFDDSGIAKVFVLDKKKGFFKKFLYEPFPVESSLPSFLDDHFNAEIVGGAVSSKKEALEYLTWTYLYQRIRMNPIYYGLKDESETSINSYLSNLVDQSFSELLKSGCIDIDDNGSVVSSPVGRIGSHYYLVHRTVRMFLSSLNQHSDFIDVIRILSNASEYAEYPVRHNEDLINQDLERLLPHSAAPQPYDSPHAKAFLLIQAHLSRMELSIPDYITDTGSVLDQAIRILQAMADMVVYKDYLSTLLHTVEALRCIRQGLWPTDSSLLLLSDPSIFSKVSPPIRCLADILYQPREKLAKILSQLDCDKSEVESIENIINQLPVLKLEGLVEKQPRVLLPASSCSINASLKVSRKSRFTGKAFCPRFYKSQEESIWVILGDASKDTLLAFKRITLSDTSSQYPVHLDFVSPNLPGTYQYMLFVCSDVYPGLDQVFEYNFAVE